jgi:hypothetical protein
VIDSQDHDDELDKPGTSGTLEPLAPAAALTMIADQLPSLGRDGGRVFQSLAAVVAEIPAFTMQVDDLDTTTENLAELLDAMPTGPHGDTAGRSAAVTS